MTTTLDLADLLMSADSLCSLILHREPNGLSDITKRELTQLCNDLRRANNTWAKPLGETRHLVQFTDDGWTIAHPLVERLNLESLFACPIEPNWGGEDPGVRGRFRLNDDGTIGEAL